MPFRFQSKYCFLTYSQCPVSKEVLLDLLKTKVPDHSYIIVSQESHQDGQKHLHAFIVSQGRMRFSSQLFFDLESEGSTYHPNIVKPNDPDATRTYVAKDGDFVEEGEFHSTKKRKGPTYGELCDASDSKEAFMDAIYQHHSRDYFLHGERIEAMASKRFKPTQQVYVPKYTDFPNLPSLLTDWYGAYFVRPRRDRPKSLILVGPSRLGKTEWARSLGNHVYVRGAWNAEHFKSPYDYIVMDDFDFSYLLSKTSSMAKSFFGCQGMTDISGKWVKTFTIDTNCPLIVCMNDDQYQEHQSFFTSDWGVSNIEVVFLNTKLY